MSPAEISVRNIRVAIHAEEMLEELKTALRWWYALGVQGRHTTVPTWVTSGTAAVRKIEPGFDPTGENE